MKREKKMIILAIIFLLLFFFCSCSTVGTSFFNYFFAGEQQFHKQRKNITDKASGTVWWVNRESGAERQQRKAGDFFQKNTIGHLPRRYNPYKSNYLIDTPQRERKKYLWD